jgi:hypothetical protein
MFSSLVPFQVPIVKPAHGPLVTPLLENNQLFENMFKKRIGAFAKAVMRHQCKGI